MKPEIPLFPAIPTGAGDLIYLIRKSGDIRTLKDRLVEEDKQVQAMLRGYEKRKAMLHARLKLEYARYDRTAKKLLAKSPTEGA